MKFNWGHGIALVIGSFMIMILYFVFDSFNHKTALVATDYYAQEVAYQAKLEKIKNAQQIKIETNFTEHGLVIHFPHHDLTGNIHFFRPSDVNLDFELEIGADSLGRQLVDALELQSGFWRMKVEWAAQDKGFYSETSFVAP